jgi:gliding motility-associated-like protein
MKKALLSALLFFPVSVFAQFPGGVSTNLKLWLKANSSVSVDVTNTVTQWNELSGAGVTGDFATQGANIGMVAAQNPPSFQATGINFNPHVAFSQTAVNSISSNNAFVGTQLIDPYNNTILQVINLHTLNNTGVWFKWQYNNTNANRLGNEVNNGGTNAGKLRFDFRGINNYSATNINDKYFLAGCNTTQAQSVIRLNGANDATLNYTTQAAFAAPSANPARITFGNEEYGDNYPTSIDIAEVIMYNRALTAAERNKVESYLAVKYGFTLDQSTTSANDYTSSNGTVIWNRAANLPFTNNITGIGRDDLDSLDQRQSRSVNTAGLVTVYHGGYNGSNFPVLNNLNPVPFSAHNTYLLFGDNGASTSLDRCFTGNPAFLRMGRSWKLQMTGAVATVTLAAKTSTMPAGTTHLLVSSDSAFTSANTTVYRLDTLNGFLSRQLVLPSSGYFTFASDSLILRPTSNSPLCVGSTIQLRANIPGTSSFYWTGPAGFVSTVANPSIPRAGVNNSGVYTLVASTNGCAFTPGNITVTVSAMPAPPTVVTPLFYCRDDVAAPLTAKGQNLTWHFVPAGGGGGLTTPPIPYTGRADTLTWWVTQSSSGCESIRSKQQVIIRNRPNGIIVATRPVICQGDVDSFYYYGDGLAGDQYNWKVPFGKAAILDGTGQGPVLARFDSAGTINVRLQVNARGCVSEEMLYSVKVNPRPIAGRVIQSDACVDGLVNISLKSLTPGITNYVWDFNNGDVQYAAVPGGPYGIRWHTPGPKVVSLVTFSAGCPSFLTTDTVRVHDAPAARIAASVSPALCMGDSLLFDASIEDSGYFYSWFPAQYFGGQEGSAAWGMVQRPGYIGVKVTSPWGCEAADSILIDPKPCCEVSLPNAFSPNGDGRNDLFHVLTEGHHQIADFRVVNRWGQTIFETHDESRAWDGTFNGVLQDIGTYYYYIRFRCNEGKGRYVEQKGEVVLVR